MNLHDRKEISFLLRAGPSFSFFEFKVSPDRQVDISFPEYIHSLVSNFIEPIVGFHPSIMLSCVRKIETNIYLLINKHKMNCLINIIQSFTFVLMKELYMDIRSLNFLYNELSRERWNPIVGLIKFNLHDGEEIILPSVGNPFSLYRV